jgi:hypothetical protein
MTDAPEDVIAGCARWLRADPQLTARVAADSDGFPLIVQDQAPDRAEFRQGVCLVVSHAGPAAGNQHNTYEQVRIQVEFWSDPRRDTGGQVNEAPAGARQRMVWAYWAVDRRLHRPQGGAQRWGSVLTTDATRLSGVTPYLVPGSDGLWRGTAFYAVGLA